MDSNLDRHSDYEELQYGRMQVRDCVKGSNAIKRGNEIYLPMPSGMMDVDPDSFKSKSDNGLSLASMPWYHENPA